MFWATSTLRTSTNLTRLASSTLTPRQERRWFSLDSALISALCRTSMHQRY
ncbi:Uncharacterized protein OBRU01_26661, partial [Operophtera brumata]